MPNPLVNNNDGYDKRPLTRLSSSLDLFNKDSMRAWHRTTRRASGEWMVEDMTQASQAPLYKRVSSRMKHICFLLIITLGLCTHGINAPKYTKDVYLSSFDIVSSGDVIREPSQSGSTFVLDNGHCRQSAYDFISRGILKGQCLRLATAIPSR